MNYYKPLLLVIVLLFAGCKTQPGRSTNGNDLLTKRITGKLGQGYSKTNNAENTLVLAWQEDRSSGTMVLRYGVWSAGSAELVYAGSAVNGKVKWLNNDALLVEDYPGIIDGDRQVYQYKIDLSTKTKIPLHDQKDF